MELPIRRHAKDTASMFLILMLFIGMLVPQNAAAFSMISDSSILSACQKANLQRYSWVRQLDPREVRYTSLASSAALCDGYAPLLIPQLSAYACGGKMIIPTYEPRPWWKPPWFKAKFTGWACA